jgi:hypothetical protein
MKIKKRERSCKVSREHHVLQAISVEYKTVHREREYTRVGWNKA